jgi:hypothetical protein
MALAADFGVGDLADLFAVVGDVVVPLVEVSRPSEPRWAKPCSTSQFATLGLNVAKGGSEVASRGGSSAGSLQCWRSRYWVRRHSRQVYRCASNALIGFSTAHTLQRRASSFPSQSAPPRFLPAPERRRCDGERRRCDGGVLVR